MLQFFKSKRSSDNIIAFYTLKRILGLIEFNVFVNISHNGLVFLKECDAIDVIKISNDKGGGVV